MPDGSRCCTRLHRVAAQGFPTSLPGDRGLLVKALSGDVTEENFGSEKKVEFHGRALAKGRGPDRKLLCDLDHLSGRRSFGS